MIKIKIIDNIVSEILQGKELIKPILSYPAVFYRPGQYRKIKTEYQKCLMFGKGNKLIYNGWIARIEEYCKKQGIELSISGSIERIKPSNKPCVPGVVLRGYQEEIVNIAIAKQQGVIHGATGVGKSYMAIGIVSCFKNPKVLYLVPSLDLASQVFDDFKKFGFDVCKLGGEQKDITATIVVSTIQTFSRLDLIALADRFEIVILDEAHLAVKKGATIEKILSTCLAPIRIGFTGTLPEAKENQLILEGLVGTKIYDLGAKEAIKMDILSKPKLSLLKVPMNKGLSCQTYQQWHKAGIVENEQRNRLIARTASTYVKENKVVIIFVFEIDHLNNISEMLDAHEVKHKKVHGVIKQTERLKIKKDILGGKCKCVVSSIVWATGLDIPNLEVVILGAGGKAETTQLQTIGRGLRKTEGKNGAIIVDFLDPYKFLSSHCIQRLGTYLDMGWL